MNEKTRNRKPRPLLQNRTRGTRARRPTTLYRRLNDEREQGQHSEQLYYQPLYDIFQVQGPLNQLSVVRAHLDIDKTLVSLKKKGGGQMPPLPPSGCAPDNEDLSQLVATCQKHTRCSEAYCLRTRHGKQSCHFGYPKPLQSETAIVTGEEPTLLTACNDGLINSFNPVQLSAWRANVDMQFVISTRRVIEYCTKYVTKSEPRSETLKDTYTRIVRSLKDGNRSLKVVQKLLIHTVGERDYSAQETCHILLQLPMYKASRTS